ncbi:S1/P1 nuclease [Maribellus sediminis]|uniref:S1/P1 nuclease n=1 Tax=Maribellus sediminis TaxID=2696285 RepID=UPI001431CEED|nr:S1/P1 nuclease [Maribellus sediminis]
MKKLHKIQALFLALVLTLSFNLEALGWGANGHRAIAEIANQQLDKSTKKKIEALLGDSYLPLYGTYADDVRSERGNPLSRVPHYVNMPFEKTYETSDKNEQGDLVTVMNDMISTLKAKNATKEEKAVALKFIIHLVADAHQPMHVGLADDLGGNKVDVKWFGKETNLHRVWDTNIIESTFLSYMELARFAESAEVNSQIDKREISIVDWIDETHEYTKLIYDNLGDRNYGYDYFHQFEPLVMQQINVAGYRLGNFLNDVMKDLKLSDLK